MVRSEVVCRDNPAPGLAHGTLRGPVFGTGVTGEQKKPISHFRVTLDEVP